MKEQIRAQILIGKLEMPTIEGLESVATPTEIKEVKAEQRLEKLAKGRTFKTKVLVQL
jgi:hypothetical protein